MVPVLLELLIVGLWALLGLIFIIYTAFASFTKHQQTDEAFVKLERTKLFSIVLCWFVFFSVSLTIRTRNYIFGCDLEPTDSYSELPVLAYGSSLSCLWIFLWYCQHSVSTHTYSHRKRLIIRFFAFLVPLLTFFVTVFSACYLTILVRNNPNDTLYTMNCMYRVSIPRVFVVTWMTYQMLMVAVLVGLILVPLHYSDSEKAKYRAILFSGCCATALCSTITISLVNTLPKTKPSSIPDPFTGFDVLINMVLIHISTLKTDGLAKVLAFFRHSNSTKEENEVENVYVDDPALLTRTKSFPNGNRKKSTTVPASIDALNITST